MEYHVLQDNPARNLQNRLELFEQQFNYPLGENVCFKISHQPHYLNFYLAMGKATCIVAENEQGVQGTICASQRKIINPDSGKIQDIVYIGDLKVSPPYQNKTLSFRLMSRLMRQGYNFDIPVVGVVMLGTRTTPDQYTGRLGLPAFIPLDTYTILQIKTQTSFETQVQVCSQEAGIHLFSQIYQKPFFKPHLIQLRAKAPIQWLNYKDESCALLENTMASKRLLINDGKEIKNAHLSYFAYRNPESAYQIILHALSLAESQSYEALFLALTEQEYRALAHVLEMLPILQISQARVYGTLQAKKIHFNLNTAEI